VNCDGNGAIGDGVIGDGMIGEGEKIGDGDERYPEMMIEG
jgi:hypothetical protein